MLRKVLLGAAAFWLGAIFGVLYVVVQAARHFRQAPLDSFEPWLHPQPATWRERRVWN